MLWRKNTPSRRCAQGGAEQRGDGGVAVGGGRGEGGGAVVVSHAGERAAGKQLTNNLHVAHPAGDEQGRGTIIRRSVHRGAPRKQLTSNLVGSVAQCPPHSVGGTRPHELREYGRQQRVAQRGSPAQPRR
jgi:hypothetical protein